MKNIILLFLFFAQYSLAQVIVYEGSMVFKNALPNSNDIKTALIMEMMPERMHQQKVVIIKDKMAYTYARPTNKKNVHSIQKEGGYSWLQVDNDASYSHKQGHFNPPTLDIVATKEKKKICGYDCKMYYNLYDYKGKTDTCFFWITDKLPSKISPSGIFTNNQGVKGIVLAEKSPFSEWEAISVQKCDKIDKKLFDWSLHPNNVTSEQLKKYLPCAF